MCRIEAENVGWVEIRRDWNTADFNSEKDPTFSPVPKTMQSYSSSMLERF